MIAESLLKEIDKGRLGENHGYTTGIDKLDEHTGGNLQGIMQLIVAPSGTGSCLR